MNNFFYHIIIFLTIFTVNVMADQAAQESISLPLCKSIYIGIGLLFAISSLYVYKKFILSYKSLEKENKLLKEKEEELSLLATTDYLTQLHNRRYCIETGEKLFHLALRKRRDISVIIFDIDDFKQVNDTYGHKVGDAVLISLGIKLSRNSRNSDVVCRFGGEEFVILLPDTSLAEALIIAEKLRKIIEELKIKVKNSYLGVTVSMGIATINRAQDQSIEDIIKRADNALYMAKNSGKNKVEVSY
jgi:diguanylate cyclase (GGDEF)-like protein